MTFEVCYLYLFYSFITFSIQFADSDKT